MATVPDQVGQFFDDIAAGKARTLDDLPHGWHFVRGHSHRDPAMDSIVLDIRVIKPRSLRQP